MLHNSPLPYHTKAGLEILLNFIFHFSTRSEYANSLFCDLLHRHKSSCCLLESFNFGFLLKAFLQGGCLTGTKILQAAEDNLNCCEHRILASPQHRQLFLYCSLPCIFCFIQNETTEQALVGHEGWHKRCTDIVGQWAWDFRGRRTRRISLPHWFLADSHTISTGPTRAKGRYCNMWESIGGALKIEWQRVILNSF